MNNDIEKLDAVNEPNEDIVDEAEDISEDALLDRLSGKKSKKASKPKKTKKARSAGAKRRLRYQANFAAIIAFAAIAVVLLNVLCGVLADKFPISLDISANKVFSLSEQSLTIAKQVTEPIELVVFAEHDTFTNPNTGNEKLDTTLREFSNALKQYNSHSDGKVTYAFINPNQEPAKFAAYSQYDVEQYDILFKCGERYKVINIDDLYEVTSDSYSGTYEITESLVEKALASNIYALSSGEEHIIQVLTGHDEDSYVISGLKKLYELNGYTFEEMSIASSASFNEKADVMLIPAPKNDYSAAEIKRVQEWVYNDGNYGRQLMVYVNPTADCPNLYELLKVEYKITVTDELILETDYNRIQSYSQLYAMADVATTDYTTTAAGTATVFTPLVRRLTTSLDETLPDNTIGEYAVQLTEYPESAKLTKLETLEKSDSDENDLYAADTEAYPLTGMIVYAIDTYNNNTNQAVEGRVMVSGCAGMAYGDYVQNASLKNEELLLDSLNTMTGIESAITISGKTVENDTVSFSNATQLIVGIGVFTVGLPLITLIICLVVFMRRKNL